MNLQHIALCIAVTLSSVGCTSVKSIFGGGKQASTETGSASTPHRTTGQWHIGHSKDNATDQTVDKGLATDDSLPSHAWGQNTPEVPAAEIPQFSFGETECANIRIPLRYNNPFFGTDNKLVLTSDALHDGFTYPYQGKVISPYGRRGRSTHTGVDIKAVPNDTIRAAWPGVVRMSKPYSGYGNVVVIRHYNGVETIYAHQSRNLVKVNDVVRAGEPVGLAGRTGRATTEHLHFEIRIAGQPINPALLFDTDSRTLRENRIWYCYNNNGQVSISTEPKPGFLLTDETSSADATPATTTAIKNAPDTPHPTKVAEDVAAQKSQPTKKSASESSSKQYHYVKKGETLSHIAVNNSTTVAKLCTLNNIKPTTVLQIKQKIRVH